MCGITLKYALIFSVLWSAFGLLLVFLGNMHWIFVRSVFFRNFTIDFDRFLVRFHQRKRKKIYRYADNHLLFSWKVECGRTHKFIFCGIQWGMAYYGYEGAYRRRRYHRPVKIRKFAVIAAILAAVIGVIVYFQSRVADLLWELSESTVYSRSAEALNSAAMQALQWNGVSYDDLVIITRDGENNVLSIEVDTRAVNLAARQTVSLASAAMNEVCEQGVQGAHRRFYRHRTVVRVWPEGDIPHSPSRNGHLSAFVAVSFGRHQPDGAFGISSRLGAGAHRTPFGYTRSSGSDARAYLREHHRRKDPGCVSARRENLTAPMQGSDRS